VPGDRESHLFSFARNAPSRCGEQQKIHISLGERLAWPLQKFWTLFALGLAFILTEVPPAAAEMVTIFTNRAEFLQAVGFGAALDDFQAYASGPLAVGARLGEFNYAFDPSATQPAVVADNAGVKMLGGSPYKVLVGGDSVVLTLSVADPAGGDRLRAFGADFAYAPSAFGVSSNAYRLTLNNGIGQGLFAGNGTLLGDAGVCFLGLIAAPGAEFTSVVISSTQSDPNTIVPACQVANLAYLKVRANPPFFSEARVQDGAIVLSGGGGMPGNLFYLRASTDVALPLSQWPRIATSYFGPDGGFVVTNSLRPAWSLEFYALEIP